MTVAGAVASVVSLLRSVTTSGPAVLPERVTVASVLPFFSGMLAAAKDTVIPAALTSDWPASAWIS